MLMLKVGLVEKQVRLHQIVFKTDQTIKGSFWASKYDIVSRKMTEKNKLTVEVATPPPPHSQLSV